MKVLNLSCIQGHGFEGWFGSEDDYQGQHARGLIECPVCGDKTVSRLPSAPRLNLSGARAPRSEQVPPGAAPAVTAADSAADDALLVGQRAELQAAWLQAVQQVIRHTEDVGERFPEEARRIHYGESAPRGIRGQASAAERAALADEGIEVLALPLPAALKGGSH